MYEVEETQERNYIAADGALGTPAAGIDAAHIVDRYLTIIIIRYKKASHSKKSKIFPEVSIVNLSSRSSITFSRMLRETAQQVGIDS